MVALFRPRLSYKKELLVEFGEATLAMNSISGEEAKVRCSLILEDKRCVDYVRTVNDASRQTVAHRCKVSSF